MTTTIEEATQAGIVPRVSLTYGYYRQPNGWITVGRVTDLEELKYTRAGWQPLKQYGRIEMASEYAADHPFEGLFMRGGAKEFCEEQIIESGFHLNPPLVPACGQTLNQFHKRHTGDCWDGATKAVFPQLEGEDHPSFQCRFCDRDPHPTEKARSQHESVMHKDEKGDIRQGEALGRTMVEGLQSIGAVKSAQESPKKPYACGLCPESYNTSGQLDNHITDDHEKGTEDGQEE